MDNVWVQAKGLVWDAVIEHFKAAGYWNRVIKRDIKPTLSEYRQMKVSHVLPDQVEAAFESGYQVLLKENFGLIDRLYRKTDWGTDRYNSASFHELFGRIRMYYDFFTRVLDKEKISLVIFWNTPHMGWDNVLVHVARHLGIKTLFLDQSKFPNKFFHFFDFYDYGEFNTSVRLGNLTAYPVEKKVEKDWFYMKKNYGRKSSLSFKKLLSPSKYAERIGNIVEKNDYLRLCRELISHHRRPQSLFRFRLERSFKNHHDRIAVQTVDLGKKFVYFPLHTQPERATSIWGGEYLDQALALERLSQFIPKDWYIYVKEAPKQKGAHRDILFFERLRLIPNLVYLGKNGNSFDLIRHSQFVATIVGTAGWEAVTGGKNALGFGWGRWYKTLPGIYEFEDQPAIETLTDTPIDHDLLQQRAAHLVNLCGTGIIYDAYLTSIPDFSMEKNTRTVTASLKQILYADQLK